MQAQSAPVVGEGRGGAAALVGRGRGRGRGRGIISALAPGTVAVGRNMQGSADTFLFSPFFVFPLYLQLVLLIVDCPLFE